MSNPISRDSARCFLFKLFIFILPLVILFEITQGGWFVAGDLNGLDLVRNFDIYYDTNHLYPSDHKAHYRRDPYGLRGEYSDPSQIDILTIGSSTVDQRYISEEDTWQNQLKSNLARQHKFISVVNAGIDGWPPSFFNLLFDRWFKYIPQLRPKYILVYLGQAEPTDGTREIQEQNLSWQNVLKQNSAIHHHSLALLKTLYSKYFRHTGNHRHVDLSTYVWTDRGRIADRLAFSQKGLEAYINRLARLQAKIEAIGAQAIYLTTITRYYRTEANKVWGVDLKDPMLNGVDAYHLDQMFNQGAMEFCRKRNQICLDMAASLKLEDSDFYDFQHNTPSGAKKIGAYLAKALNEAF